MQKNYYEGLKQVLLMRSLCYYVEKNVILNLKTTDLSAKKKAHKALYSDNKFQRLEEESSGHLTDLFNFLKICSLWSL